MVLLALLLCLPATGQRSASRKAAAPKGAVPEARMQVVALPSQSPLVTFRFVFLTGAADDPGAKAGVAALTAAMLAQGGTQKLTYQQILDAQFPMATNISYQIDKEMTTFSAVTHVDNLGAFYELFRAVLLEPGWRAEDFQRLRDDAVNFLRVDLRSNNEEELGKEMLYNAIYRNHPYGRYNAGTVAGLNAATIDDVRSFYGANYTQSNLVIGLAGGYPADFLERVRKDFSKLPEGSRRSEPRPKAPAITGRQVTIVDKPTRSVAISIGHPLEVKRGHADFIPLLVAQTWLGQHRTSGFRLYERIREVRGLNYGDYAYIEYFPRGMFQFEPDPNLGRERQIFQIWIRPLELPTAHFGLRLAMYEFDRFVREGIDQEGFERTRSYLSNYVNLLTRTKSAELGYAIDSRYYGIPDYNTYLKNGLARLKRDEVNGAIKKHIQTKNIQIVLVAEDGESWKKRLLAGEPSPIKYNATKPADILEEDKTVEKWQLDLKPENIRVVPVSQVFE